MPDGRKVYESEVPRDNNLEWSHEGTDQFGRRGLWDIEKDGNSCFRQDFVIETDEKGKITEVYKGKEVF